MTKLEKRLQEAETMSEKLFSRWLSDVILIHGHVQRIESTTGSGIPDINYCFGGTEVWIETKIDEPLLRPFQWSWIQRRVATGGRVFVITCWNNDVFVWNGRLMQTRLSGNKLIITSPIALRVHKKDTDKVRKIHQIFTS